MISNQKFDDLVANLSEENNPLFMKTKNELKKDEYFNLILEKLNDSKINSKTFYHLLDIVSKRKDLHLESLFHNLVKKNINNPKLFSIITILCGEVKGDFCKILDDLFDKFQGHSFVSFVILALKNQRCLKHYDKIKRLAVTEKKNEPCIARAAEAYLKEIDIKKQRKK